MPPKSVLVVGAGVAGPILAYFLSLAGISVTVVERAPSLRDAGQIIDVRGVGLKVLERMEILDQVMAKATKEEGMELIDSSGKPCRGISIKDANGKGFTAELEIARGSLVEVLYRKSLREKAGKADIEYLFDNCVTEISEIGGTSKVNVIFMNRAEKQIDIVVIADGLPSRTRDLVFTKAEVPINHLNAYISFFRIPRLPDDGTWSKAFRDPGGRVVMLRPDGDHGTRAYLSIVSPSNPKPRI